MVRARLNVWIGAVAVAGATLVAGCEGGGIVSDLEPPRPLFSFDSERNQRYVCSNGVAQREANGAPAGSEVCVRCNLGYVLFNTVCNRRNDIDGDGIDNDADVDRDNDGLIEIGTIEQLYNIRYGMHNQGRVVALEDGEPVLSDVGAARTDNRSAVFRCAEQDRLCGYELVRTVDFDIDNDGRSWTIVGGDVSLDEGDDSDFFDIANGGWVPIGDGDGESSSFDGIFDGNGHAIANMASSGSFANIGLFATLSSTAQIGNLLISDALVEHTGSDAAHIGVLAGTVVDRGEPTRFGSDEQAAGGRDGDRPRADGVGAIDSANAASDRLYHAITDVQIVDESTVIGSGFTTAAGGMIGLAEWVAIDNSMTDVEIRGSAKSGGLVGMLQNGSILYSNATGEIVGAATSDQLGGLVGEQQGGVIQTSSASVSLDGGAMGRDIIGGLVGYKRGGDISGSAAAGRINIQSGGGDAICIGGLVGTNIAGNIIVSGADSSIRIDGAGGDGVASSLHEVGGLVCSHRDGDIIASYAMGDIVNDTPSGNIGGIVGLMEGGSIVAAAATVSITHSLSGADASGAIGGVVGAKDGGTVTASYSNGMIRAARSYSGSVGGLIGTHTSGAVESSYAIVNITNAPPNSGALIGLHNPNSTTHRTSYGLLTGSDSDSARRATATDGATDGATDSTNTDSGAVLVPLNVVPQTDGEDADLPIVDEADALTAMHLGSHPAWTTDRMPPLLHIVDYDGDADNRYSCDMFPSTIVIPSAPQQRTALACGGSAPTVVGGFAQ